MTSSPSLLPRLTLALLLSIGASSVATLAGATTTRWDASLGKLPTDLSCPWGLVNNTTGNPAFAGGHLTISTSGSGFQNMYYEQHGNQVSVPDPLVIEFRARFVSGTSNLVSRTSMTVQFQRVPFVVNNLFIQEGEIFLLAANLTKGASAGVPTSDAMHTYRIVLTGDSIAVYYDGTPTLIGHMFSDPNSQPDASIIWGEASGAATGTSEWEYFQHNAGLSISSPNLVRWSANGHCYEAVYAPGLTWEQARSQCDSRCGYLATITAHDEECLVESLFETNPAFWYVDASGNALGPWTGGYQQPGSTEPGDGWTWLNGEPFAYANWSFHDPDNCCGVNENRIEFIRDLNALPTRWTDADSSASFVQGYIFESDDCDSGTPTLDTPSACATASVLPSPYPQSFERLDVLPNPIHGAARLNGRFAGATNGEAEITIHDVSGRRIASEVVSVVGGHFETSWEALTRGRGALPAGVYLVRVRSGVAAVHRTVIVTH